MNGQPDNIPPSEVQWITAPPVRMLVCTPLCCPKCGNGGIRFYGVAFYAGDREVLIGASTLQHNQLQTSVDGGVLYLRCGCANGCEFSIGYQFKSSGESSVQMTTPDYAALVEQSGL